MATYRYRVTTHNGGTDEVVLKSTFTAGPEVLKDGSLEFTEYTSGCGNQTVAVYSRDYWLKAERVDE